MSLCPTWWHSWFAHRWGSNMGWQWVNQLEVRCHRWNLRGCYFRETVSECWNSSLYTIAWEDYMKPPNHAAIFQVCVKKKKFTWILSNKKEIKHFKNPVNSGEHVPLMKVFHWKDAGPKHFAGLFWGDGKAQELAPWINASHNPWSSARLSSEAGDSSGRFWHVQSMLGLRCRLKSSCLKAVAVQWFVYTGYIIIWYEIVCIYVCYTLWICLHTYDCYPLSYHNVQQFWCNVNTLPVNIYAHVYTPPCFPFENYTHLYIWSLINRT